jgi:hypothetical protein
MLFAKGFWPFEMVRAHLVGGLNFNSKLIIPQFKIHLACGTGPPIGKRTLNKRNMLFPVCREPHKKQVFVEERERLKLSETCKYYFIITCKFKVEY